MNGFALFILAIVAGFLFYQLKAVLGQVPEKEEGKNVPKKSPSHIKEVIIDHEPEHLRKTPLYQDTFLAGDAAKKQIMIETLTYIQQKYPAFILPDFMQGLKTAYNMILDSFTQNKLTDIQTFVTPDIYQNFAKLRKHYDNQGYEYINVITEIEKIMILDVAADSQKAVITAEIHSKNVNALKDAEGKILHGSPDSVKEVVDTWILERAFASNSPAWILVKI